ncbi:CheA signal transduction histidine kinase [Candidatus Sulfotelmatobacter kueseliae]|uniref:Chemotaxis protein CheA n=1 Tax=Candidatus Sulfotelmatobacter kueseliae TaxID=2042962 RepID=A0A2U3K529_9BACT|nr:CheA signal transduction histidine kinase [Candidatus Sulfotelmatobacter kueseliae]
MDIDRELLLKSFVSETGEGLAQMEEALLELESHPEDAELVNTVFRVVHTFKGNAGIFELRHAQEFAHALEDLLDKIRARELSFSPDVTDVLLASMDVLRTFTAAAAAGKDAATAKSQKLLQQMKEELEAAAPAAKHEPEGASEPAANAADKAKPAPTATAARTLRVDVQKLDRLLDLTGEIAIARGRTARLLESREQVSIDELAIAHDAETTLQAELQELVMKVRMVPVGPLFRQYQRTVRDLARELGKTVNLQIEGGEVEVDTSVVEHLRDPMLHMVRNALDHGIERPEQRRKAGKPPAGTITLRARHEAGNISIEVEDDGAGLDRARILDAAKTRGIAVDPILTDHEVYQLVFESGLSTTAHVSNFSGRGVGMDVVRRNVQALRGSVSVSSRPGRGSTVHLRFPLTLAIIEGFGVDVGENTYVIPLDQVVECVELPVEQRDLDYGAGVLQLRGEPVPYLQLRDYFQLSGGRGARQNVVVVQHDNKRAGLVVDTLHGATQTVIKPLAHLFKDVPGVSSSAILSSGQVALILDVSTLLRAVIAEQAHAVE